MGKESKEAEAEKKAAFKIDVTRHEKFDDIIHAKFITATDFCKMISSLFRSAFADYEGCITEKDQQGHLSVSLFFNHSEPKPDETDGRAIAVSRDAGDNTNTKNDVVRRIRENDNRNKNGDRYFLTDDGKSALEEFMYGSVFRKDGSVNWNRVTAEVNVNNNGIYNQQAIINTKVSMLDPIKLVSKIYGQTDEDGNNWVYDVKIVSLARATVNFQYQQDDMLVIEAVSEEEVAKLCNYAGIPFNSGINIIH